MKEFFVEIEGWGDYTIKAFDEQNAAEIAVDRYISEAAAYEKIDGDPIIVQVRGVGCDDDDAKTYSVTTEATWVCHAEIQKKGEVKPM